MFGIVPAFVAVQVLLSQVQGTGEIPVSAEAHRFTFAEIQAHARTDDLRILAADSELRSLQAQYQQAAWAWFPKLETFITVAGPMPEAQTAPGSVPYENVTPGSTMYSFRTGKVGVLVGAQTTATVPIFTFGKLTALKEAAEQGVVVGEQLRERTRAEVAYQCAEAWYGYQLARTVEGNLDDSSKQLDDAKKRVHEMLRADSTQVSKLDAYKLDFFENLLATQKTSARRGRELALAALRILAGVSDSAPFFVVDEDLADPKFELKSPERYVTAALRARPEVKLAAAGVAARDREVFIRERSFLPDFFLGGTASAYYTNSAQVVTNPFYYDRYNQFEAGIGLGARLTFDLPVKLSQLDQAEADRDKTAAERDLMTKSIGLEVKQTVGELHESLIRLNRFGDSERTARRWLTGAFADFEVGLSDTRELIEALAAKSYAGGERLRALHDSLLAIAALQRAVGADPRTVQ